jgi:membrane protein implicated in regulation of membrane protease activity
MAIDILEVLRYDLSARTIKILQGDITNMEVLEKIALSIFATLAGRLIVYYAKRFQRKLNKGTNNTVSISPFADINPKSSRKNFYSTFLFGFLLLVFGFSLPEGFFVLIGVPRLMFFLFAGMCFQVSILAFEEMRSVAERFIAGQQLCGKRDDKTE